MADILRDVGDVERKVVGLARAVPADKYAWRPAPGVRSVGDVVMHVAADNYLFPAILGTPAPAATGITGDYKTAQAFEQRQVPRDSAIAELERSFAFLKKTISRHSRREAGREGEHVRPAVHACSRPGSSPPCTCTSISASSSRMRASNGVKPPWSQ